MQILILAPSDKRNRYKFLMDPLKDLGHDVVVVRNVQSLILFFWKSSSSVDVVISIGVGTLSFFTGYLLRLLFWSHPVRIARLGGNPITDLEVNIDKLSEGLLNRMMSHLKHRVRLTDLKSYRRVIVVSEDLKKQVSMYVEATTAIDVIPQFYRAPIVRRNIVHFSSSRLNILCVTNFQYPEKADGVLRLVSVIEKLSEKTEVLARFDSISLKIAGGGHYLESVKGRVSNQRNSNVLSIDVLGKVDGVDELYLNSSLFVYASDRDAVPNVLLEAKCSGLPIVAFRSESSIKIVRDNMDGFIVDAENDAVPKIASLVCDPEHMNRFSRSAIEDVNERFSYETVKKELGVVFRELELKSKMSVINGDS